MYIIHVTLLSETEFLGDTLLPEKFHFLSKNKRCDNFYYYQAFLGTAKIFANKRMARLFLHKITLCDFNPDEHDLYDTPKIAKIDQDFLLTLMQEYIEHPDREDEEYEEKIMTKKDFQKFIREWYKNIKHQKHPYLIKEATKLVKYLKKTKYEIYPLCKNK